jgi:hypothetical protein
MASDLGDVEWVHHRSGHPERLEGATAANYARGLTERVSLPLGSAPASLLSSFRRRRIGPKGAGLKGL